MHRPRIMHNRKRLMALFLVMNLVLSPLSSYAVEEGRIETGVEGLTENREELARKEDAAVSSEEFRSSEEGEDAVSATDESKTAEELSKASAEESSEAVSSESTKKDGNSVFTEEEKDFAKAGEFRKSLEDGTEIQVSFEEGTFPKGTKFFATPILNEKKIEKALAISEKLLKQESAFSEGKKAEKEEESASEVIDIYGIDLSFKVKEENGIYREVEPEEGKEVSVSISYPEGKSFFAKKEEEEADKTVSESKGESDSEYSEELSYVLHLKDEEHPELIETKEEEGKLLFNTKSFSPYYFTRVRRKREAPSEKISTEFKVYWTDPATTGANPTRSYTGTVHKIEDQKDVVLNPANNARFTTTYKILLNLKGRKDTVYPEGTVSIDIPVNVFKSWDPANPGRVLVKEGNGQSRGAELLSSYRSGIPKAPNQTGQSSFNYTEITKTVNGKQEAYYRLTNYRPLEGNTEFGVEVGYDFTPTMLGVTKTQIGGKEVGEYKWEFPVELHVNHDDNQFDLDDAKQLSVDVRTKVEPTTVNVYHGRKGQNQGLYFDWDKSWGERPSDDHPGDFFYGVYYVEVARSKNSSQAFDYVFTEPSNSAVLEGGKLIGAKKYPQSQNFDDYRYKSWIDQQVDASYKDITKYMDGTAAPASQPWLANPIGKTYLGIPKDPYNKHADKAQYVGPEEYNGTFNTQIYALLYRYPMQIIEDAKAHGINMVHDGIYIGTGVKLKEIWADTYEREQEFTITDQNKKMHVLLPETGNGTFKLDKWVQGDPTNKSLLNLDTLQSFYAKREEAPLVYNAFRQSFSLSYISTVSRDSVNFPYGDDRYTTNGVKFSLQDNGEYSLLTLPNGKSSAEGKEVAKDLSNTHYLDPITGGNPYSLTEEDFSYKSFFVPKFNTYDVKKHANPAIKVTELNQPSTDYAKYPEVKVMIRKKGEAKNHFTEYGTVKRRANGDVVFVNQSGTETKISETEPMALPVDTVGIDFRGESSFYRTEFTASFTLNIHPTTAMANRIQEDINKSKTSLITGPAEGRYSEGASELFHARLGESFGRIGYELNVFSYKTDILKEQTGESVYHSDVLEQWTPISIELLNKANVPVSMRKRSVMDSYLIKEGIFYDLLPFGTYVNKEEVELGTWEISNASPISASRKYIQDTDYTVRFQRNWEGTGQTMMIVEVKVPDSANTLYWDTGFNCAGMKLKYTLHNPYTNIIDRGREPMNTVGFLNTGDTEFKANFTNTQNPDVEKREAYRNLMMEGVGNGHKMILGERKLNFKPITVIEANLSNTVSTEIHKSFLKENISYLGEEYRHRLQYQAAEATRTKDFVFYDILGEESNRNGDFQGLDLSSLKMKASYNPSNPSALDYCKPVCYYATTIPDDRNVDDSTVWKAFDPDNMSGIDKKSIKAIAIDCRKTVSGQNFILDQKGIMVAYVEMLATKDSAKVPVVNTNIAYRKATLFTGGTVPMNVNLTEAKSEAKHAIVPPLTLDIPVKKELEVPAGLTAPDIRENFSFNIRALGDAPLTDQYDNPIINNIKNPDENGGIIRFSGIRIVKPGIYKYRIKESKLVNTAGVIPDSMGEKELLVTVVRENNVLKANLSATEEHPLIFRNVYGVQEVKPEIKVSKSLLSSKADKPDISGKYHFTLKALNGAPMPDEAGGASTLEKTNPDADGGQMSFGRITFTTPGEYKYELVETGEVTDVRNDERPLREITITVSDFGTGKLIALVSGDSLEYKNRYIPDEPPLPTPDEPSYPGGGGGTPRKPIFPNPNTPGGPGEKPKEPDKPTVPEEPGTPGTPENPTPGGGENVPPTPSIPERIRIIEKRIGEILGEARKRPLTPEEQKELKRLGEVLGALRREQSRKVNTADTSRMLWYALASSLSIMLLAAYSLLERAKKKR